MSLLNKLVKVSISISGAVPSADSFDKILIVGPAPSVTPSVAPPMVGVYSSIAEIVSAGFATTDAIYKAASIAFANGASELYVAVQQNSGEAVEDIETTLNRALETSGWYAFSLCGTDASSNYVKAATWADTNNKLFGFTVEGSTNPVGTSHPYAFGFGSKSISTNPDNAYTHIALMAVAMQYVAGSETWAYKSLAGIEPENFTTTEMNALEDAGLNYFVECAGKNITLNGKTVSGEWIDVIRFRDWIKNDMQTRIYNVFIMNPKVAYTSAGIALIENQMLASLEQGQANGGISPTEYSADGSEIPGFTVSVPNVDNVGDADRAERSLKNCKFTARLAGAIHLVELTGTLVQ